MPEKFPEFREPAPVDVLQEYGTSLNPAMRFEFYKYAYPSIDPEDLIRERLNLNGSESILDVGCSNGAMLEALRNSGHTGKLIGIDIAFSLFAASVSSRERHPSLNPSIDFMVGNAEDVPLADDSVDISSALFMLYHCNPKKALMELKRVTKPGGTIVVSTSGPDNKIWHRAFEKLIAEKLGSTPSPRFNSAFDTNVADLLLPQLFPPEAIEHIPHRGVVDLSNKPENTANREAFSASLLTMKDSMKPLPKYVEWKQTESLIWELIDRTVNQEDLYEYIERDYYFCKNL